MERILRQIKLLTHNYPARDRRLAVPIPRSKQTISWVISKQLAVGSVSSLQSATELAKYGIQVVVSLCAETEANVPLEVQQSFEWIRLVLPDSHCPKQLTPEQLAQVVAIIHHYIDKQQPVFIHCLAGIERSPIACIAYLCKHHQFELWEATKWLKQIHPRSMPTAAQMQVIRKYIEEYK